MVCSIISASFNHLIVVSKQFNGNDLCEAELTEFTAACHICSVQHWWHLITGFPLSSYLTFYLLYFECHCFAVTAVRSARQVIDALNAEGANIDIILGELDLPLAKGMKMLKYINRDKELRRIPVISKFVLSLGIFLITLFL